MHQNKNILEKKQATSYALSFSQVFEKSFEIYKEMFAQSGIAVLLYSIIIVGVNFTLMTHIFEFNFLEMSEKGFVLKDYTALQILLYLGITALVVGLTTPMMAGIFLMCKQTQLKQEVLISSIFELYQTSHFKSIFIFSFSLSVISSLVSLGFDLIELPFLALVFYPLIYLMTFLVYPLIIFQNLTAFQALRTSFILVSKNILIIFALMLVAALASFIGIFGLCIGIFFTVSFFYCVQFSTYMSIFPNEEPETIE